MSKQPVIIQLKEGELIYLCMFVNYDKGETPMTICPLVNDRCVSMVIAFSASPYTHRPHAR